MVGVLYATVKRWFSPGAALLAGAVAALTPVAALMFRFNNPDALLVLLLTARRVRDDARARGRAGRAGSCSPARSSASRSSPRSCRRSSCFPAFGLVYLVAGPPRLGRRVGQLVALGVTTLVAAGWWVAIVQLYAGVATSLHRRVAEQQLLERAVRLQRLRPAHRQRDGQRRRWRRRWPGSQWGPTGWTRLFNDSFGGQASWLIPAALLLLGGRARVHVDAAAHRPHARRADPVGRDGCS